MARSVPIGTVWPSSTLTSLSVPATGDGISVFTLSVWTSTRRSYLFTLSPGCFSHFPIVPSVTDSPSLGIFSSKAMTLPLVRGQLAHLGRDLRWIRHEPIFLWFVVRHRGNFRAADAHNWGVQIAERLLRDQRRDLGPRAEHAVVLIHDQTLTRLPRFPRASGSPWERPTRRWSDNASGRPRRRSARKPER